MGPLQPATAADLRALVRTVNETSPEAGAFTRARRFSTGVLLGAVNTIAGKAHPAFALGGDLVPLRDPETIRGAMMIRGKLEHYPALDAVGTADSMRERRPLLHSLDVTVPEGDHAVTLDIQASAAGNDFAVSGRENSPIAVYVNGQHHSDLFLLAERTRTFNVNFADLPAGTHQVELRDARDLTTGGGAQPVITSARQQVLDGLDALVARHAPAVETRWSPAFATGAAADQTHSDVPLLQIAVVEPAADNTRRLRYYLLSSNEDASGYPFGTIMRKFGRTTDYELMYEAWIDAAGKLTHDNFQGPMHIRRPFEGSRMGERPILRVATRNGLFSSQSLGLTPRWSEAPVARYVETPTDREVMAADPWSFTLMGKENLREGRSAPRGTIPINNTIAYDAREHLYFEANDPARTAMEAAKSITAHLVDGSRVTFPVPKDDFRPPPHGLPPRTSAIALPPNIPSGQIASLELPGGTVFTLDDDFKVRGIALNDTARGQAALVAPDTAFKQAPHHARHEIAPD